MAGQRRHRLRGPVMLTTDPTESALHQTQPDGQRAAYLVLSDEERARGFVRPVRLSYIHRDGCKVPTSVGQAIAETFARDPSYYSHTYCAGCRDHKPVAEFAWTDGQTVGE